MTDTARHLAPIKITDETGHPVTMGTAWEKQPVLLVFIRHFG
jgi:hypothetical protein